jgi:hypothetical protein
MLHSLVISRERTYLDSEAYRSLRLAIKNLLREQETLLTPFLKKGWHKRITKENGCTNVVLNYSNLDNFPLNASTIGEGFQGISDEIIFVASCCFKDVELTRDVSLHRLTKSPVSNFTYLVPLMLHLNQSLLLGLSEEKDLTVYQLEAEVKRLNIGIKETLTALSLSDLGHTIYDIDFENRIIKLKQGYQHNQSQIDLADLLNIYIDTSKKLAAIVSQWLNYNSQMKKNLT